jgi:SAM-dependent methyltransferase
VDSAARVDVFRRMLTDLGTPIRPGMKVLDFGCGEGGLVRAALDQGLDAYGCDLYDVGYSPRWTSNAIVSALKDAGRLRQIRSPYQLPFGDSSIDVVVSDQVFEHVLNYPEAIAELRRIMRPGGFFLHAFPSRYRLIETHIHVPLASVFRPQWWLWIWALLGVRNEYQHGLPPREVARRNADFLTRGTNYLPPSAIRTEFAKSFSKVAFVENAFLPHSGRPRILARLPFGAALYALLFSRFLYGMSGEASRSQPADAGS